MINDRLRHNLNSLNAIETITQLYFVITFPIFEYKISTPKMQIIHAGPDKVSTLMN